MTDFRAGKCVECGTEMFNFFIPGTHDIEKVQLDRLGRDLVALSVAQHLGELTEQEAVNSASGVVLMALEGELKPDPEE